MKKFKLIKVLSLFLFLSMTLSACSTTSKKPITKNPVVPHPDWGIDDDNQAGLTVKEELQAQSRIKKFKSQADLVDFLENNSLDSGGSYGINNTFSRANIMMEDKSSASDSVMESMPKAGLVASRGSAVVEKSDDFSKTNIQVKGVDEADIIKTDGKYIYAVSKNNLFIIDGRPAEKAEILAKIEFKSRPSDIYINDNSLVVFGSDDKIYNNDNYKYFRRRGIFTFFKVFDISNPKDPKQVRDLDMEGSYTDSRMIGDYVYFVTTNYNYYYMEDAPVLPRIIEDGKILVNDCNLADCYSPDIYYFNIPYDSYNFTSITAINIADNNEDIAGDVYLMSRSQNIFVSADNIYLTYTKYISEYQLEMEVIREIVYPKLSEKDQEKIVKIEKVDNFILNKREKNAKIYRIIERFEKSLEDDKQEKLKDELEARMRQKYADISKELEKTVIHKIAIEKGCLEYKTTGEVTGHVLNQFSMDEHNGYFRIATTKNRNWSRYREVKTESYSNLYVLDKNLKQVGAIEKLAKGEKIYSVRFMQNRAYMVTFRQTDPLFVIDLVDPKNPKVLGELKVPGYSNYLHPYDENTLIGIGKDISENEWGGVWTKGVKLSLFDVSQVSEPKEIDTYVLGGSGSNSIALSDHKAFLFSLEKNLLVLPISIQESIKPDGEFKHAPNQTTFRGAAVFKVDKDGFKLQGRISHSDKTDRNKEDYWHGYNYYDNTVKRSLYIDDVLYTFSNNFLLMNKLEDLELVKKLGLKKEKKSDDRDFDIVN